MCRSNRKVNCVLKKQKHARHRMMKFPTSLVVQLLLEVLVVAKKTKEGKMIVSVKINTKTKVTDEMNQLLKNSKMKSMNLNQNFNKSVS